MIQLLIKNTRKFWFGVTHEWNPGKKAMYNLLSFCLKEDVSIHNTYAHEQAMLLLAETRATVVAAAYQPGINLIPAITNNKVAQQNFIASAAHHILIHQEYKRIIYPVQKRIETKGMGDFISIGEDGAIEAYEVKLKDRLGPLSLIDLKNNLGAYPDRVKLYVIYNSIDVSEKELKDLYNNVSLYSRQSIQNLLENNIDLFEDFIKTYDIPVTQYNIKKQWIQNQWRSYKIAQVGAAASGHSQPTLTPNKKKPSLKIEDGKTEFENKGRLRIPGKPRVKDITDEKEEEIKKDEDSSSSVSSSDSSD